MNFHFIQYYKTRCVFYIPSPKFISDPIHVFIFNNIFMSGECYVYISEILLLA